VRTTLPAGISLAAGDVKNTGRAVSTGVVGVGQAGTSETTATAASARTSSWAAVPLPPAGARTAGFAPSGTRAIEERVAPSTETRASPRAMTTATKNCS
jgi:hypothetical protein